MQDGMCALGGPACSRGNVTRPSTICSLKPSLQEDLLWGHRPRSNRAKEHADNAARSSGRAHRRQGPPAKNYLS